MINTKESLKNKQVIVTCNNCHDLMGYTKAMSEEDAKKLKSKLVINPFGAPRCKKCKGIEPYNDINLAHTIEVVDFDSKRKLA